MLDGDRSAREALRAALDGATVLVTGGAGFVGAHLAVALAVEAPGTRVIALDNLHRRGSELKLPWLAEHGVAFVHGDIREPSDLDLEGRPVDLILECAAEPSVLAGYRESPRFVLDANLGGVVNCLELARERRAGIVFLSTSRVYPIAALNHIAVEESDTRYEIAHQQALPGVSERGVSEAFPLAGPRSLYGATKLAAELLVQEYGAMYDLPYVIDRCGTITGPGQMGRVEQGVFVWWVAQHYFGGALTYQGWGGQGKQVRDLVHVDDLWTLIRTQFVRLRELSGRTYNVGGGYSGSLSLREATSLCQEATGRRIPVHAVAETHPSDVRVYVSDHDRVTHETAWRPTRAPRDVLTDILAWLRHDERRLAPFFSGASG